MSSHPDDPALNQGAEAEPQNEHAVFGIPPRAEVAEGIANGLPTSQLAASLYPDIIMAANSSDIPAWALRLIRRPAAHGRPRHVFSRGQVYHVQPVAGEFLVSTVEYYERCKKPIYSVHNVVTLDRDLALATYHQVEQFVANPATIAGFVREVLNGQHPNDQVTEGAVH